MNECEHTFEVIKETHYAGEPTERLEWCSTCGAIRRESYDGEVRIEAYSTAIRYPSRMKPARAGNHLCEVLLRINEQIAAEIDQEVLRLERERTAGDGEQGS